MKKTMVILLCAFSILPILGQSKNLDEFIREGLKNSPLLKEQQNKLRHNQLDSLNLSAAAGFQVTAESNNTLAPVINGWGYDEVLTDKTTIGAQLKITKELSGAQIRRKHYQAIALQNRLAKNLGQLSEQELRKNITEQYVAAYNSQQLYLYNRETLQLLDREDVYLKKLTQATIYKQTDYLNFSVNLRQQRILVKNLQNQYDYDYLTLSYLCGMNDTTVSDISDPKLLVEELADLSKNAHLQQFILDSLKIRNEHELVGLAYQPTVNIYADAGYLSSMAVKPGHHFGASAGLNLSIPIYDGGQKGIQHRQLDLNEQDRRNYADFYKKQYRQQRANLSRRLKANREILEQLNEQITLAQTLIEANHKLLESGDLRISDYLNGVNNILTAKSQLIQNTVERYQIINELNYWNHTN